MARRWISRTCAAKVRHLIGFCHNDACRHQALIDVSDCPDHLEVRWFQQRAKCAKWGGRNVDVRPNWNEARGTVTDWRGNDAMPGGE